MPRTLLAVFAHPDDETFGLAGTFAMYSERGVEISLVEATCGEAGEISDLVSISPSELCEAREDELRQAMEIVGVRDVEILGYPDGKVAISNPEEITGKIVYHIRRVRPDVVVTFGPDGIYGHPDHVAMYEFTSTAFFQASNALRYPEHLSVGLRPHTPKKLYYNVIQRSRMALIEETVKRLGIHMEETVSSISNIGVPDDCITAIVDVRKYFDQKWEAIQSHRTQLPIGSPFRTLPKEVLREAMGVETYQRAFPPPRPGEEIETDLFAGI